MAGSQEEVTSLLMKVKEESENTGLKLNIQKTKIMPSDPITSWKIDRETIETVTDFTFLGSKITADGDCSHEIKRHLLIGRKAMTNESRDIILSTNVYIVTAWKYQQWPQDWKRLVFIAIPKKGNPKECSNYRN